jgi:TANFOR domain-containing protein
MITRKMFLNKMIRIKLTAIRRLFLVFGLMIFWSVPIIFGQPYPVTLTLAVSPPYTSKIDDYIAQPNKIIATLINTSSQALDIYIRGKFENEGGISVSTDPEYKIFPPLTLLPGIPYTLNRFNLEQVFDPDHLVCLGITINEVIYRNGLPEDNYTICLQAFDDLTGEPLSAESPQGCSNTFLVLDLEAPVLLSPADGTAIEPASPQEIIFICTRPPGAPANTQFNFKIIEVLPSDRNINDAMKSATHPVFFETTVSITSCLLGPADPTLTEGKTYACMVTAYDPSGQAVFRNHGESELISFSYRKEQK